MKTLIFAALLLCTPVVCFAATGQADCPPETIWNSSTNKCYPDPAVEAAKRERMEQEKLRKEEEYRKEQERLNKEKSDAIREDSERSGVHIPAMPTSPYI